MTLSRLLVPNRLVNPYRLNTQRRLVQVSPRILNFNFSRNSLAYTSTGSVANINTPRFEQGKFDRAIMIEEGTKNLVTNPLLATDSNADGVADGYTKQVDPTITATYSISNGQRIAITASTGTGNGNGAGIITSSYIPVSAGQSITASVYANILNRSGTTWITFFFYWYDSSYTQISTTAFPASTIAIGQQRIISSAQTVPTNAAYVKVNCQNRVLDNGSLQDVVFTRLQVEAKPYATSFIDGTRSPETLTIPTTGVLNPQEGTVECWVYVPEFWQVGIPYWRRIWGIGRGAGAGMYVLRYNPTSGNIVFEIYDNSGMAQNISVAKPSVGWHYFADKWSASEMALLIDGVKVGSITNPNLPSSFADTVLSIGCRPDSPYDNINTLIDDLRISNRARTDEEIATAYASGQPLPVDSSTTCRLTFDITL